MMLQKKLAAYNNIAIIPARGGSQRIPRKNIRELNGKPLIAHSIQIAQQSGLFKNVIVSTDDEEIAKIAREWGAETPFLRPDDLADHFTGTTPVMQHALRTLINQGYTIDNACLIYATCPLLTVEDLQKGFEALATHELSFAATTFDFPIQRSLTVKDGKLTPLFPEHINQRSQDLEEAIHDAGQYYWGKTSRWLSSPIFFSELAKPVMLPRHRVQDLDTEEDWKRLVQITRLDRG